jgi:hypothetical protein
MQTQFSSKRGSECSGITADHDLYKNIGDVEVCIEFEMLKVKVSIIFLCTWVSCYVGMGVTLLLLEIVIKPCDYYGTHTHASSQLSAEQPYVP